MGTLADKILEERLKNPPQEKSVPRRNSSYIPPQVPSYVARTGDWGDDPRDIEQLKEKVAREYAESAYTYKRHRRG